MLLSAFWNIVPLQNPGTLHFGGENTGSPVITVAIEANVLKPTPTRFTVAFCLGSGGAPKALMVVVVAVVVQMKVDPNSK